MRDDGLPAWVSWDGDILETPPLHEFESMVCASVCEALDGCTVEPDGYSPDGAPSWLLAVGLI